MIIKCDYCGKETNKLPNKAKKNKYSFCSRRHYWIFKRKKRLYSKTIDKTLYHKIIRFAQIRGN